MFKFPQFIQEIPGIGKYKGYIGAAIILFAGLSGFFHALGDTAGLTHDMLTGDLGLVEWAQRSGEAISQAWLFGLGLFGVGARHAIAKGTGA
jgi:hypothetical protein